MRGVLPWLGVAGFELYLASGATWAGWTRYEALQAVFPPWGLVPRVLEVSALIWAILALLGAIYVRRRR